MFRDTYRPLEVILFMLFASESKVALQTSVRKFVCCSQVEILSGSRNLNKCFGTGLTALILADNPTIFSVLFPWAMKFSFHFTLKQTSCTPCICTVPLNTS